MVETIPHSWNVTPKEAIQIQKELKSRVLIKNLDRQPKIIAGVDVSMNLFSTTAYAGFVIMTYSELKIIDQSVVKEELKFPYIPGLLSFREIPVLLSAWEKLKTKPDLLFVDGVGIAHPRRLGIASHLGIVLDLPTIGCAKKVLTGTYAEPDSYRGSFEPLVDHKEKNETMGAVVRTKTNVKPMFISPGHKISIEESVDLVLKVTLKHRMPEPTRMAHLLMNKCRVAGHC